jgi:hypothetical protein
MVPSYIILPGTAPHSPWPFFFPDHSMFVLAPPAPEPRRPTLSRGDLRASLLHGADYLDASLDAMLDDDDAEFLRNLETLRGLVVVAIDQISSSQYLRNTSAGTWAVTYGYRKPRLSADAIAKASGSSIMAVLQSLDLRLKQDGPHELAGDCPRCGGVNQFSINATKGSWSCRGCDAKGNAGISLLMHARGFAK